jgi:hypothetical protein
LIPSYGEILRLDEAATLVSARRRHRSASAHWDCVEAMVAAAQPLDELVEEDSMGHFFDGYSLYNDLSKRVRERPPWQVKLQINYTVADAKSL